MSFVTFEQTCDASATNFDLPAYCEVMSVAVNGNFVAHTLTSSATSMRVTLDVGTAVGDHVAIRYLPRGTKHPLEDYAFPADGSTTFWSVGNGGDFGSLTQAFRILRTSPGENPITLTLRAGRHPSFDLRGVDLPNVTVQGTGTTLMSTSMVFAGSAGAYTVTITPSATSPGQAADIAVGDQLVVSLAPSGGTGGENLLGLLNVTAVNVGANTVTAEFFTRSSIGIPSGVTSFMAAVLRSSISGNCFLSRTTLGGFGNLSMSTGLFMFAGATIQSSPGYLAFPNGGLVVDGGAAFASAMIATRCRASSPVLVRNGGLLQTSNLLVGPRASVAGTLLGPSVTSAGQAAIGGLVVHNADSGILVNTAGRANLSFPTIQNCVTGIVADTVGQVSYQSATFTNNTTNASPTVNTAGAKGQYIAS